MLDACCTSESNNALMMQTLFLMHVCKLNSIVLPKQAIPCIGFLTTKFSRLAQAIKCYCDTIGTIITDRNCRSRKEKYNPDNLL